MVILRGYMNRNIGYAVLSLSLVLTGCPSDEQNEADFTEVQNEVQQLVEGVVDELSANTSSTSDLVDQFEGISTLAAMLRGDVASGDLPIIAEFDPVAHAQLRQAHQAFALSEYRRLAYDSSAFGSNLPDSVMTAALNKQMLLGMTMLGAAGTTLDVLQAESGLGVDETPLAWSEISAWDQHVSDILGVSQARQFWGQAYYLFSDDYLNNLSQLFAPEMQVLDFQSVSEDAAVAVNASLTEGLNLSNIDYDTRLVHAQQLALALAWSDELQQEAIMGRFAVYQEEQRLVEMVRLTGFIKVSDTDQYRAVEVPLENPELSLLIIESKGDLEILRDRFDSEMFENIVNALSPAQATVSIPLFQLVEYYEGEAVADLGVAAVESDVVPATDHVGEQFMNLLPLTPNDAEIVNQVAVPISAETPSDDEANFTPVNKKGYLYVSEIKQHVSISLTQNGLRTNAQGAIVHSAKSTEPAGLINQAGGGGAGFSVTTPENNSVSCYYEADQQPFIFAVYAPYSGSLFAVGHVNELPGERVPADWKADNWSDCSDSPSIEIYRYTGEIQCESSDVDLEAVRGQLLNAGIAVLGWGYGSDGLQYPAVCGAGTGNIYRFTIREQDYTLAQEMGFSRLSDLENPIW